MDCYLVGTLELNLHTLISQPVKKLNIGLGNVGLDPDGAGHARADGADHAREQRGGVSDQGLHFQGYKYMYFPRNETLVVWWTVALLSVGTLELNSHTFVLLNPIACEDAK